MINQVENKENLMKFIKNIRNIRYEIFYQAQELNYFHKYLAIPTLITIIRIV